MYIYIYVSMYIRIYIYLANMKDGVKRPSHDETFSLKTEIVILAIYDIPASVFLNNHTGGKHEQ